MTLFKCAQWAVLIFTVLLVTGCAGVTTPPNIIFQDSTYLIRLDFDRGIGGPDDPDRHSHPLEIGRDQLRTIFEATHVQEHRALLQRAVSGPATPMRAFSEHDIAVLAAQVHKALLHASPQQYVVFAIINAAIKQHEITGGRIFVNETNLHLILNCFRSFEGDSNLGSPCGPINQQAYDLNFAEKDYFVDFGSTLFGNGRKEIIVDFSSIPSSVTDSTSRIASVPGEAASNIAQPLPLQTGLMEQELMKRLEFETPIDSPAESIAPTTAVGSASPLINRENPLPAVTDDTTNNDRTKIQRLEREIEALTQVVEEQRETLEQRPSTQQDYPARILFLTTPLMRGDDVATLQRTLGFSPDRIDGIFGKDTDRAVRMFQRQRGMNVDGKVGADILNALR